MEALPAVLVASLGIDELLNCLRVGQSASRSVALVVLVAILFDTRPVPVDLLISILNLLI